MRENIAFELICADYTSLNNVIFYLEDGYEPDCVDDCIIWGVITFYGVPEDLPDDQMNEIYEGNYEKAIKIGEIFGCLIISKYMLDVGEDPLFVCDASSGDLEYVMSALSDAGGPLNMEPYQDVYYIHEIKIDGEYEPILKGKILDELPNIIFSLLHVSPDIVAFYPAPLEYTPDPAEKEKYDRLQRIAAQKLDLALNPKENGNVINFASAYKFSDDDLKMVTRRRYSGSSYPEEAKDLKEYAFYQAHGFEEAGNSRVLYKS